MRSKPWALVRAVVVAGGLSALVVGCAGGDADQAAGEVDPSPWPWEAHPPTSSPSPTESPATQVVDDDETEEPTADPDGPTDPEESGAGERAFAADLEAEVVTLTDQIRADHGCDEDLSVDDRLVEAARAHSDDMVERDYFDHTTPDGVGPGERAEDAGYPAWGGENIASGYLTAQEVMDAWMDSEGHRANIVNCGYVSIGVGAVEDNDGGYYWTQSFGWE